MSTPAQEILKKYWGFDQFRSLQEDIIYSVLEGKDTLALLPTGGGKSICFQVPGMLMQGITIVVSPLIALMKDQVENLKNKGISAVAISSDLNIREIDTALDNCIYGKNEDGSNKIKFLYLSPERLGSELVQRRLSKMNISLIAVDEAHCISQWGYDFRPSYLKIAEIRAYFKDIPILALTATATQEVVDDIQAKLNFKSKNVLSKSFFRSNLSYIVVEEENKLNRVLKMVSRMKGSGLIYVRNRRSTKEVCEWLLHHNISAAYYHAGLEPLIRNQIQYDWKKNKTRIIVCTNAFGMGIDKPDVRFVIHLDLPDSIEAYFQEAGRAGRDENKAFGILLYNESDKLQLEDYFNTSFPDKNEIKKAYQAICNYYQIAIGAGENQVYDFNISEICKTYRLNTITFYNSLKFLERDGYITLTEAFHQPSKLHINCNRNVLYDFQLRNMEFDGLIKQLLRTYSGLFDEYVKISEFDIAKRFNVSRERIVQMLQYMNEYEIASYVPQKDLPQILFNQERIDASHLIISKENYDDRKKTHLLKKEAVIHYASEKNSCRNRILLNYLGEQAEHDCGQCDVCITKNNHSNFKDYEKKLTHKIFDVLKNKKLSMDDILLNFGTLDEIKVIELIRELLDEGKLTLTENKYQLNLKNKI